MKRALLLLIGLLCWVLISWRAPRGREIAMASNKVQKFSARGILKELKPDRRTAVIQHEAISNYMDAMTMPFNVKDSNQLAGLQPGDPISFRLLVRENESWIDHVTKLTNSPSAAADVSLFFRERAGVRGKNTQSLQGGSESPNRPNVEIASEHPLMNYQFTNEFGQPVTLARFKEQALGITFFFTRCPIPEYCPRLSRNFEEASKKLASIPGGPTNWHFLSISIDPQMDTPGVLRTYARHYHYDSNHWSFLTGPVEKV